MGVSCVLPQIVFGSKQSTGETSKRPFRALLDHPLISITHKTLCALAAAAPASISLNSLLGLCR